VDRNYWEGNGGRCANSVTTRKKTNPNTTGLTAWPRKESKFKLSPIETT
jgi:hypothetical protein